MDVQKVIKKTSIVEIGKGIAKNATNAIAKSAPKINGLYGLDALASQNTPLISKKPFWDIPDEKFSKLKQDFLNSINEALADVKERLKKCSSSKKEDFAFDFDDNLEDLTAEYEELQKVLLNASDDRALKFVFSLDNLEQYTTEEINILLNKFSALSAETKENFYNSKILQTILEMLPEYRFSYLMQLLEMQPQKMTTITKYFQDDLLKNYSKKFFENGINEKSIEELEKTLSTLQSNFCSKKGANLFYNSLSKRTFEDIKEISELLSKQLDEIDEKELNEYCKLINQLLNATTPDGNFIFGTSKMSDTTSKGMISGIENILSAKKNDNEKFKTLMNLLQLTQEGKVPSHVLGTLAKEGKINKEFIKAVNETLEGINSIAKFTNTQTALAESEFGDVLQIDEKLFYRGKDGLTQLNLSPEAFSKLFPKIETMAIGQGEVGDCYLISAICDFLKNPNSKEKIYQMFSSEGNDIIVTIPDAQEFPIRFKDGVMRIKKDNAKSSLGVQMLEEAYTQTRMDKYGVNSKQSANEGGIQANVYNALLNNSNAKVYSTYQTFSLDKLYEDLKYFEEEIIRTREELRNDKSILARYSPLNRELEKLERFKRYVLEDIKMAQNTFEVDENELLAKVLNTSLDENLISLGTKNENFFIMDKMLCSGHAYSVLGIDKENEIINLINPWNSAQYIAITFDEFKKYFNSISIAKI